MARFTQYPAASTGDYAEATTFLIANDDGEIKQASLEGLRSTFFCNTLCASLVIPSAQVLQLNSTPQVIVPAQGVGTAIEVVSAFVKVDFNSAAYATNTDLQLIMNGGSNDLARNTGILLSTTSAIRTFLLSEADMIENADLTVNVRVGNPTSGDSDIEVFVLYRVINV
jgi:hypothetical protein